MDWYWQGLPTRTWLLPIPALNQPMLNQIGLLLIRLAVGWVFIRIMDRERTYRSGPKQHVLSSDRLRYREPYYTQQLIVAGSGLLLGLFLALSGGITGAFV